MHLFSHAGRRTAELGAAAGLVALLAGPGLARERSLPTIVFVSRDPAVGSRAGQVPGLGPHGTFATGTGRLMERSHNGLVRALLPGGRFMDVADPVVSPDGARLAFAGVERPGGRWRIWVLERASGTVRCVTGDEPGSGMPYDDADPCWWRGDTLVFASTRAGGAALYDGTPVTQLWVAGYADVAAGGRPVPISRPVQLTHEANGALDPCVDPAGTRLVYTRWWFNPFNSARAGGLTRELSQALVPDSVNVWQVVSARLARDARGQPALTDVRLAAGGTAERRRGMGVQPARDAGGGLLAVSARNMGLSPRPGAISVQRFGRPPAAGHRIAGAAIGDERGNPYAEASNLQAPAACAPVGLPDGRVLLALDPGGRGDFGLWLLSKDGEKRTPVLDFEHTLELDPAIVPEPRSRRPTSPTRALAEPAAPNPILPPTFRYLAADVFAGKGAPERRGDARLRVYRLARGDSAQLLHDVAVPRSGRIGLDLPADTPLFEQLTDPRGVALMSAHGPAQVRGFNSGAPGTTSRCTGCHLGHSTLPTR